jgi:mycofactocin precursor
MTVTTTGQQAQSAPVGSTNQAGVDEARTESAEVVELVEADLLVEDVSIDGMCGVY